MQVDSIASSAVYDKGKGVIVFRKVIVFIATLAIACFCLAGCSGQASPSSSSSSATSSSSSSEEVKETVLYVLNKTNLLEKADAESAVVVELEIGAQVKTEGQVEGAYTFVTSDDKQGYVLSADVTESQDEAKAAKEAADKAAEEARVKAEEEARAKAEEEARVKAEEEAKAKAEEEARVKAEEEAKAKAKAEADAKAKADAQAKAEADAAAKKKSSDKKATSGDSSKGKDSGKSSKPAERTVKSKEYVPPCDGHADGYTIITYSDGTEEIVEGKA